MIRVADIREALAAKRADDELVTIREAAAILDLSYEWVRGQLAHELGVVVLDLVPGRQPLRLLDARKVAALALKRRTRRTS